MSANSPSNGWILTYNSTGGGFTWAQAVQGTTHDLLDGNVDKDTAVSSVAKGSMITGQGGTPKWTALAAPGTSGSMLYFNASGDIAWNTSLLSTGSNLTLASNSSIIDMTGTGTLGINTTTNRAISTGTGAIGLNGATTLAANMGLTMTAGSGQLSMAGYNGTATDATSIIANSLTSGSGLSVTSSSVNLNSTNGLLYIANTGASTNGITARIQSNSTAGSGLTVLGNGNVGIGTNAPSALFSVGTGATSNLTVASTGNLYTAGTIGMKSGSYTTTIQGSSSATASVTYNLPINAGSSGLALITDGSGGLSWGSVVPQAVGGTGAIQYANGTTMTGDNTKFAISGNNFGIGTSAAQSLLEINGNGAVPTLQLSYSADHNTNSKLSTSANGELNVNTSYATDSSLVIGNGSAIPSYVMYSASSSNYFSGYDSANSLFRIGKGTTTVADAAVNAITLDSSNRVGIGGAGNGTYALYVNGTGGTSGGVYTTSDARYKKDVAVIDPSAALSEVMNLRGVSYNYDTAKWPGKNFPTDNQIGFVAQEVESVIPQIVNTDSNGYKSVAYDKLTAVIVNAVQQQQAEIVTLQTASQKAIADIAAANLAAAQQATDIASLTLKTDQNVTTLTGLQASVDDQLTIIGSKINDHETRITGAESKITDMGTRVTALETFQTSQSSINSQLQAQIDDLKKNSNAELQAAQISLNTADISYLKAVLGLDGTGNPGDIKLAGKLVAKVVAGGALEISVSDESLRTIGTATISATNGDAKSVGVNTLKITDKSKIFTSFQGDPGSSSWVEKIKDNNGTYTGFKIMLKDPIANDTAVDWWIVEEN